MVERFHNHVCDRLAAEYDEDTPDPRHFTETYEFEELFEQGESEKAFS